MVLFSLFFLAETIFFSHKKSANSIFQPIYNSSRTAPMPLTSQPWAAKPPRFIASGLPANGLVLSDMAGTPSDMAGMRSIEQCVSAPSYPPKALLMYDVAEIKILLQCLTRDAVRVKWSSPLKYKVNYPFFPINLSLG
jgi:hypothetical protein